jgi:hypothetical protein
MVRSYVHYHFQKKIHSYTEKRYVCQAVRVMTNIIINKSAQVDDNWYPRHRHLNSPW